MELIHLFGINSLSACDSSALSSADILRFDPNQAQQNIMIGLDPNSNCLTLMLFLKDILKMFNFEKKSAVDKKKHLRLLVTDGMFVTFATHMNCLYDSFYINCI